MPHLRELLSAHPLLDLRISINDRRVDMIQEGVDCLIRIGPLPDSDLVARKIRHNEGLQFSQSSVLATVWCAEFTR